MTKPSDKDVISTPNLTRQNLEDVVDHIHAWVRKRCAAQLAEGGADAAIVLQAFRDEELRWIVNVMVAINSIALKHGPEAVTMDSLKDYLMIWHPELREVFKGNQDDPHPPTRS